MLCQRFSAKRAIVQTWYANTVSYDFFFFSANIDCDFETNLCGWTNDVHDDYDWKYHGGRTPTAGTGPSTDHTKGKDGGY